jgi:multidrug resistance efflux pump
MKRGLLLPALAVLGFTVTAIAVVLGSPESSGTAPAPASPRIPYAAYVAGAGLVEARQENIPVGTPVAGIVVSIPVRWGDRVKPGDVLFQIDDRDLQAQLPPALAKVKQAEAALAQASLQLKLAESVPDPRAVSREDMGNRRTGVAMATTALASAQADVEHIRADIALRTVHARTPGRILQINIHLGEYAQAGGSTPPVLLGDDTRLLVRASIDQNDAWRVAPGAVATAYVRGNPRLVIPLQFERIEPTIVPRAVLTGDSAERVDTRVLQVIYSFDPARLPVFVGQVLDVYIDAPAGTSDHAPAARP